MHVGNPPSQCQVAGHWGVLVVPCFNGRGHGLAKGGRCFEVREALGNVEGTTFSGQSRHFREDGRAHLGHL